MKLKNLASTQVRHARAGGHPGPRSSRGQALDSRFRGNEIEGTKQLQNLFLVSICFLFVLLLNTACSRSKKEQTKEQTQAEAKQTEIEVQTAFFQDDLYPLRIDYIPGLNIDAGRGERYLKGTKDYINYTYDPVGISVNLYPEFFDERGEYSYWDLIDIDFFPTEEDFKDFLRRYTFKLEEKLIFFGNIPALPIITKGFSKYLLFVPNYYSILTIENIDELSQLYPEEITKEHADRVKEVGQQMLARIQWLKPIDVNSQEFKDWKAHILKILDEARGGR